VNGWPIWLQLLVIIPVMSPFGLAPAFVFWLVLRDPLKRPEKDR